MTSFPSSTLPQTLWLTGLSGSGKTTLAEALRAILSNPTRQIVVLDGDKIRKGLSNNLGFDIDSRMEHLRRTACVAKILNDQNITVICSTISPFEKSRNMARSIIGHGRYIEIYVNTALEVCERRDPKGLYKLARSGQLNNFTGISSPYEIPVAPDIVINMAETTPESAAHFVIATLNTINH